MGLCIWGGGRREIARDKAIPVDNTREGRAYWKERGRELRQR